MPWSHYTDVSECRGCTMCNTRIFSLVCMYLRVHVHVHCICVYTIYVQAYSRTCYLHHCVYACVQEVCIVCSATCVHVPCKYAPEQLRMHALLTHVSYYMHSSTEQTYIGNNFPSFCLCTHAATTCRPIQHSVCPITPCDSMPLMH